MPSTHFVCRAANKLYVNHVCILQCEEITSLKMLILLAGHSSLPPSCPVCEHSPLSADDCTPNKSLRTTIKVFLRTAEKKREANRPKESQEPAPEATAESQNGTQSTLQPSGDDGANSAQVQTNGSSQVRKDQETDIQSVTQHAHDDANKVCYLLPIYTECELY